MRTIATSNRQTSRNVGTVQQLPDGRWQGILTLKGRRVRLPIFEAGTTEAEARRQTAKIARAAKRMKLEVAAGPTVAAMTTESISGYVDRVFTARSARGLRRQDNEQARITNHVLPVLLHRKVESMQKVTAADCRAIVEVLDNKAESDEVSPSTAYQAWSLWKWICRESCSSKIAALRVRPDDPAAGVLPPDRGSSKARQWLYPEELSALLACERVPVRWRRIYALTTYLCLRAGELGALEAEDVDLQRGRVRVDKAMARDTKEIGPTKTEDTRVLDVPKNILPLLQQLLIEVGGRGRLLALPPFEDLAANLRDHIARAGIIRRELTDSSKTSVRLRFHDLRATGISYLAMLPEMTGFDIRDYAGHTELSTTDKYVRRGRKARDSVAAPFGPIPPSLLDVPIGNDRISTPLPSNVSTLKKKVWRPQRDSNSCYSLERAVSWAGLDDGDRKAAQK